MRALMIAALLLAPLVAARAAYEDLGAGARAPGMANAFAPVADDVYTLHYNPAGLGLLERPQLGTAYTSLYPGLRDGSSLSSSFIGFAQPLSEGKSGTLGASWESFALSSLYREDAFSLGYGRLMAGTPGRAGEFYAGGALKYLRSSFGTFAEASNAVPTGGVVGGGQADPVLSGRRTQAAFDADLGVLHRFGNSYAWGASLSHVTQPNVAFAASDADRLPLTAKLGLSYRSLISNVALEADTKRGPDGKRDTAFSVGAERWFPKLFVGDFGLRGGLSLGTRDYRQATVGLSYRTKRLQADYALMLPLGGGVDSTIGAHRVSLSFRFGRRTEEEESLEMVLEAMKQLKAGQAVAFDKKSLRDLPRAERATLEELLGQARSLESKARYADALEKLGAALTVAPADKELVARFGRLSFVGKQIKQLPDFKTDPMQASLHLGLLAYLAGDDVQAVRKVAEAARLRPGYKELEIFLAQLELVTGLKRPEAQGQVDYQLAVNLTRANAAIEEGRYKEAVDLAQGVLLVDPDNAAAWQDLGTAYFALKQYDDSLKAWKKAYALEPSPAIRSAIKGYMRSIERAREHKPAAAPVAAPVAPPPPQRPPLSPQEREELFNQAVDAYTRRDFRGAKERLERILQSDPENVEAQKALRRVKDELP